MHTFYRGGSTITGRPRAKNEVTFKGVLSKRERLTLLLFLLFILSASGGMVWYLLLTTVFAGLALWVILATTLVLLVELIRIIQSLTLLIFAYFAKDPVPMVPHKGLRIAVLTTIVPGKEPFELVANTLKEMKRIKPGPGNKVDVWLLDEGDDPYIQARCLRMGVKHFSRKGVKKWNTEAGTFKARTKHGNHNAWRSQNENNYDIVAQMDPDHVPRKNFLTRTLGYFVDPDVGFVVAPQVYGNHKESWIARASAFQAYVFHGIIQRGGNGLGAPLLIGTNHLYRVKAFQQINGYQDSIIEDHLTSMAIFGAKNTTGNRWKGVYTPDILAVGEGPTSFTDYFNQQKRWAYGIWEIAGKKTPSAVKKMSKRQTLAFLMLQFFYPSLAMTWVISSMMILLFSFTAIQYQGSGIILAGLWACSITSTMALFLWLRRFNLMEHERKDWGLEGMALLLMCIPVYASAGWQAITQKPLTYAVTAKGNLASPDSLKTFTPHLHWLTFNIASLVMIYAITNTTMSSSIGWALVHTAICASPIAIYGLSMYKSQLLIPTLRSAFNIRKLSVLRSRFIEESSKA